MSLPLVAFLVAVETGTLALWSTSRTTRALAAAQQHVAEQARQVQLGHRPGWGATGSQVLLRVWDSMRQAVPPPRGVQLLWADAVAEITRHVPQALLEVLTWNRAGVTCWVDRWLTVWQDDTVVSLQTYELIWRPPVGAFLFLQLRVLTPLPDDDGGQEDEDGEEEPQEEDPELDLQQHEYEEIQVEEEEFEEVAVEEFEEIVVEEDLF